MKNYIKDWFNKIDKIVHGLITQLCIVFYRQPDFEFYVVLIKMIMISSILLGVSYVMKHINVTLIPQNISSMILKIGAYFGLPLILFYIQQWYKARLYNRDENLERMRTLTDDLIKADKQLQIERNRFRQVIEMQTEFIIKYLPTGEITFANRSFYEMIGFNNYTQLIGLNIYDYLGKKEATRAKKTLRCITIEQPCMVQIEWFKLPGNYSGYICIEWENIGIFKNNKLYKILSVGRDVTDRIQMEQPHICEVATGT